MKERHATIALVLMSFLSFGSNGLNMPYLILLIFLGESFNKSQFLSYFSSKDGNMYKGLEILKPRTKS